MKKLILQYTLLSMCLFIMVACNRTPKEMITSDTNAKETVVKLETKAKKPLTPKVESYESFYNRFHKDSVFQMSRIKFPVKGYYTDAVGNEIIWNKTNWIMHRSKIQDADTSIYKVKVQGTANVKSEELYIEGGGFKIERKFQLINGKWYLVNYIDENL